MALVYFFGEKTGRTVSRVMESAPIFIIGTERSGSNLLRLILNTHSAITVPHPPHILNYFHKYEDQYGDLSQPAALQSLIRDVLRLLSVHIHPWEFRLDPEEVARGMVSTDLMGVFFSVYEAYRKHSGKRRWACKSTFMIHHIDRILAISPRAKFLLLVRDPRDVVLSSQKSVFSPYHPYFTAQLWRQQQLLGLRFHDLAEADNCLLIRYEDLLHDPQAAVSGICRFLGEDYEPAMLEYYKTSAAKKSERLSASWRNTGSPIIRDNSNKFEKQLRKNEIRMVEQITGDLMLRFGYPLFYTSGDTFRVEHAQTGQYTPDHPGKLRLLSYRLINLLQMMKVECRSLLQDANSFRFWCRRFFLLSLHLRFLRKGLFAMPYCRKIHEKKRSYNS